jgi:chromosome segregation ATPase
MEDLINTSTLLPQVLKERDEYRKLLDEASFQRDSYKGLYDSEKESYETLSLEITNISNQRNDLVTDLEKAYKENVKISDKLEKSHTTMELWLISGSTAVVFTAVGIIVGIYAID